MSNIINHEQWGKMNDYLHSIAVSLGSTVDVSTWEGVQKAVRMGLAPDLFPIGTQLKVNHGVYGEQLYDVVAHDYLKSAKDENAHTMTLMSHGVLPGVQYDAPEAFYYAENELPAGTYNFTISTSYVSWSVGTYQFILTKALPKGGQLVIGGNSDVAITSMQVRAYVDRTTTQVSESANITQGNGGTNLGTFGNELNHIHRISYGSDNYKESAFRQFLNSSAVAGSVWTPQTKFDRPPSWVNSLTGFLNGLDEDFLSVIGEVIVPCSANNTYESPDSATTKGEKYTVVDRFCLASQKEIFGNSTESVADNSVQFPSYKGANATDYIKYRDGSAAAWRLRTSLGWNSHDTCFVTMRGEIANGSASVFNGGGAPVCTIV